MKNINKIKDLLEIMIILQIIQKETNEDKKILAEEITRIAKEKYQVVITKQKIIELVAYLREEIDYKVFQYPEGYMRREEELDIDFFNSLTERLLRTDYVVSSNIDKIINKLKKLLVEEEFIKEEIKKIKKISKKTDEKENKKITSVICECIKTNNVIDFKYKTNSILLPYKIESLVPLYVINNNKEEYLVGMDINENIYKYYKISKIVEIDKTPKCIKRNVEILPVEDFIKSNKNKFNLAKEEIIFTFAKEKLDYVVEEFCTDIEVLPKADGNYIAIVKDNKENAKNILLEIIDKVEILKPDNLALEIDFLLWQIQNK